jgi:P-type Cu+ transporter
MGRQPASALIFRHGALLMRAQHVGATTLLAQTVQMVALALRSRAPMQGLADTVAGHFVYGVVASGQVAPHGVTLAMSLSSVSGIGNALRLRGLRL